MFRSFLTVVSLTLATSSAAEEIPRSQFVSGNWTGAAYLSDSTGSFSHCAISAPYRSGDTLHFAVLHDATVSVGVSGPALGLVAGERFPVSLFVDRREPFHGTAEAISADFAALNIPDFDAAMDAFKRGRLLHVVAREGASDYDLSGTFRALERARQCAIEYLNFGVATGAVSSAANAVDPAIAYQLATGMITELGVSDARYLTASELREMELDGAVYWVSDAGGIEGGVMFFNRDEVGVLKDMDSVAASYLSRACEGDVGTLARAIHAEVPTRQVKVMCAAGEQSYEAFLTASDFDSVRLVTVLSFETNSVIKEAKPRQELSEALAIQNATFFVERQ